MKTEKLKTKYVRVEDCLNYVVAIYWILYEIYVMYRKKIIVTPSVVICGSVK